MSTSYQRNENTPCRFKCPECLTIKQTEDEIEAHLNLEHLKNQPYECQHCGERRASELLMQEHFWAAHKLAMDKVFYIPNKSAKTQLRELMRQAVEGSSSPLPLSSVGNSSTPAPSPMVNISSMPIQSPLTPANHQQLNQQLLNAHAASQLQFATMAAASGLPIQAFSQPTQTFNQLINDFAVSMQTQPQQATKRPAMQELGCDLDGTPSKAKKSGKSANNNNSMSSSISNTDDYKLTKVNRKPSSTDSNNSNKSIKQENMICRLCNTQLIVHSCGGHVEVHLSKLFKIHLFSCGYDGCDYGHYARRKIVTHMLGAHGEKDEDKVVKNLNKQYYDHWKKCLAKCVQDDEITKILIEKRNIYLKHIGKTDCIGKDEEDNTSDINFDIDSVGSANSSIVEEEC